MNEVDGMQILLVEDNPDLVHNIVDFLEVRGYGIDVAYNGYTALGLILGNAYDAIVLDLMLPGVDGLDVCAKVRTTDLHTPILMLTARDSLDDKLAGFASGADDYLIKPFALLELDARLRALGRRVPPVATDRPLRVGDLVLNTTTWQATRDGKPLTLTPIPLRMLKLLMERSPNLVGRGELERCVWGKSPPESDALRTHLHQLRAVIDKPFPRPLLHTVRGFGYRLTADE